MPSASVQLLGQRDHQRAWAAGGLAEDGADLLGEVLRQRAHRQRAEAPAAEDQQVEAVQVVDEADELGAVGGVGDVTGHAVDAGALDGTSEPRGVAGVGDHDPAGVVEGAGEGEAEAGGAAGDEGGRWAVVVSWWSCPQC